MAKSSNCAACRVMRRPRLVYRERMTPQNTTQHERTTTQHNTREQGSEGAFKYCSVEGHHVESFSWSETNEIPLHLSSFPR